MMENNIEYPAFRSGRLEWPDAYAGRYKSVYLFVVFLGVLISSAIYYWAANVQWEYATRVAVVFALSVCVIHILWRTWGKPRNFLAPDVFYVLFYGAFHLGYLALWLFGIVPTADEIFRSPDQYYLVMFIVNLGLLGFLFGYELAAPREGLDESGGIRSVPTVGWTITGTVLMLLALLIHIGYLSLVGFGTLMTEGYQVYIHMEEFVRSARLWRVQFHLFSLGFGIYIVSVALRHGRLFYGKLGISLFLIYFCLLVLGGGRTQLVTLGMILLLVRHYLVKPIKLKSLIVIAVCALTAFTAIKIVRNIAAFDISRMTSELSYARAAGMTHWYDSLVEMGRSVSTVNLTTMLIPEQQSYWYGRSYLQSLIHIFPYMQTVTLPYVGASPSGWLTITHFGHGAAGTGFSIAAEGYLNFGLPGVFLHMAVMGIVLRRIYVWFVRSASPISSVVFIVSYGLFMITVRNHVNLLVSPLVKVLVFAWLLKTVFGQETSPETNEHEELNCV